MPIQLEKATHAALIASIKRFFDQELDEEIGDLKAERVLEFCLREIGPSVYNQAVADAQSYFQEKAADFGALRYQDEFDYWKRK